MAVRARFRWRPLLGGAAIAAVLPVAWLLHDWFLRDLYPVCFFRVISGRLCPLCGLTRSLSLAVHGQFWRASQYHPMWPCAMALVVIVSGLLITSGLTGSERPLAILRGPLARWTAGFLLILLVVLGAWRLLRSA